MTEIRKSGIGEKYYIKKRINMKQLFTNATKRRIVATALVQTVMQIHIESNQLKKAGGPI